MTQSQPPGSCVVVVDDDGHGDIVIEAHGAIYKDKFTSLLATERALVAADMGSLAAAVRSPDRYHANLPDRIYVVLDVGDGGFDPYNCNIDEVFIEVDEDRISGSFEHVVHAGKRLTPAEYDRLLSVPLSSLGCRVAGLEFAEWDGSPEYEDPPDMAEGRYLTVHVVGETVENLLAGSRLARALLLAVADGPIDAAVAADLVRAGLLQAVIGLPESDWLEVKSQGYELVAPKPRGEAQKYELAQDVARFANSDVDGILLIGYKTKQVTAGQEIVSGLTPIKLKQADAEQHRRIVDDRVYPNVEGLRITQVPAGEGRCVLMIEVPSQPDYLRPFLVTGAIVGDRVDGSFISIVKRRGEHSIVIDPSQLHAQLVAGRTLLRRKTDGKQ